MEPEEIEEATSEQSDYERDRKAVAKTAATV